MSERSSSSGDSIKATLTRDSDDEDFDLDGEDEKPAQARNALVSLDDEDTGDPDDEPEIEETRVAPTVIRRRAKKKGTETETMPKPNKANASKPRKVTLEEVPRTEIVDLGTRGYPRVRLDINRRTPGGQWTTIRGGIVIPPNALLDLQDVVQAFAGGGLFIYTVSDPDTREQLVDRWQEVYDGLPREPRKDLTIGWSEEHNRLTLVPHTGAMGVYDELPSYQAATAPSRPFGGAPPAAYGASLRTALTAPPTPPQVPSIPGVPPAQYDPRGALMPPPKEMVPPWLHSYPALMQWHHLAEAKGVPMGSGAADVANQWTHHEIRQVGELKADLARERARSSALEATLHERVTAIEKEAAERVRAAEAERIRYEREIERTRHEAEMKALTAKIDALANAKPAFDMTAVVGLASAFAPVAQAWVSSGKEARKTETEQNVKLLTSVLAENGKKKDASLAEILGAAGGVLAPFAPMIVEWMKNKSPGVQAEVMQMEQENRLMLLKMMADMISSMQPEPETPAQQIIQGIMQVVGSMAAGRGMLPPGQQQQPRAMPASTQDAAPPPASDLEELFAKMQVQDAAAANYVRLIYQQLSRDWGFHTHEWATLIFNLHVRLEPTELAPAIAEHIAHCEAYQILPPALANVFAQPAEALQTVFGQLPISREDPAYVEQVMGMVAEHLRAMQPTEAVDATDGEEDSDAQSGRGTYASAPSVIETSAVG